MTLIDNAIWYNIRFAYVVRLVLLQLGPTTTMTFLVVLTRPYVILSRRLMGLY